MFKVKIIRSKGNKILVDHHVFNSDADLEYYVKRMLKFWAIGIEEQTRI